MRKRVTSHFIHEERLLCREEVSDATHGQVIEALIASRLTSPSPLVHVGAWAWQFAVGHVLGLAPDVLNDDRIARALDALAPVLEQVTGSVGAAAIGAYGIEVSQLHWDMTSVSLHGAYEHPDEDYAQPRFGHPKDRRADLKQIQAGVAAADGGAVPVFFRPYDGGAGEVCQVTGAMEALRKLAGPRRFLLAGDSKLLSYANIAAMIQAEVSFLAPASKSFVPASALACCDYDAAEPAGYLPGRPAARPAAQRGRYRVHEDSMTITGPRKKDPSYTLRRVFVHSSANAGAARRARARARPGPASLSRPPGNWAGSPAAWARGTTPTQPRSPLASAPSRPPGASQTTCAPTPAPAQTGGRPWTGASTRPRSTPKPPPTAGTRC